MAVGRAWFAQILNLLEEFNQMSAKINAAFTAAAAGADVDVGCAVSAILENVVILRSHAQFALTLARCLPACVRDV